MRYMMMIKADARSESGAPPDPRLAVAMAKYTEDMTKAGVVLFTGGLAPSAAGTRIVASGGKLEITDGPFPETKELIAGFAIVQARSKEEVLEWGTRFLRIHQEILGPTWEGTSEIRPLVGPDDLGASTVPNAAARDR